MKIIAVYMQKGGVGKTVTSANLAYFLALMGYAVVLLDIDDQANLSKPFGKDVPGGRINKEAYAFHVLRYKDAPIRKALRKLDIPNLGGRLYLIPSGRDVAAIGNPTHNLNLYDPEDLHILGENLAGFESLGVDYIIIDCAAGGNPVNHTALVAADYMLSPINCTRHCLDGLGELQQRYKEFKSGPGMNPKLKLGGLLINNFDPGRSTEAAIHNRLRSSQKLKNILLDTEVRKSNTIDTAITTSCGLLNLNRTTNTATLAFRALADEVVQKFT